MKKTINFKLHFGGTLCVCVCVCVRVGEGCGTRGEKMSKRQERKDFGGNTSQS